mmetsp:Transcript_52046/g.150019  ORF Transcript_52046/g.150019 Transcript_52046/m.150019 type:complete len:318 (-) Transcript_52046:2288-3241(-)
MRPSRVARRQWTLREGRRRRGRRGARQRPRGMLVASRGQGQTRRQHARGAHALPLAFAHGRHRLLPQRRRKLLQPPQLRFLLTVLPSLQPLGLRAVPLLPRQTAPLAVCTYLVDRPRPSFKDLSHPWYLGADLLQDLPNPFPYGDADQGRLHLLGSLPLAADQAVAGLLRRLTIQHVSVGRAPDAEQVASAVAHESPHVGVLDAQHDGCAEAAAGLEQLDHDAPLLQDARADIDDEHGTSRLALSDDLPTGKVQALLDVHREQVPELVWKLRKQRQVHDPLWDPHVKPAADRVGEMPLGDGELVQHGQRIVPVDLPH